MEKATTNIKIFMRCGSDTRFLDKEFDEAYRTKKLPDELEDIFTLTFLENYNPDGSDRMIVDFA